MAAAAGPTIRDLLYAYLAARDGYERFKKHRCNTEQARNCMALMLWIDQGHGRVTRHLPAMTDDAFEHVLHEARTVLDLLHTNVLVLPPSPLLSALCQEGGAGVDLVGFLAYDLGFVVRALAGVLDGPVAKLVFDDRLYDMFRRHQTGILGRKVELEGPYVTPPPANVPEDFRSMFITFSRGQSVERDEVFNYFRHKWGDCIVRVLLEKTKGMPPMYGRIIFRSEAFVSLALNGEERVAIFIRDREIWLRKYIPRPNNNN
ncbi:unnamed protein product [Urochloa humidicola]